jgi:hypothetical protein
MTLGDIDDAMGWATGTARRRRWRDPAAGGLPPADAELGGIPLWFRATIARWATEHPPREPVDAPAGVTTGTTGSASAVPPAEPEPEPAPAPAADRAPESAPEPQPAPQPAPEPEPEPDRGPVAGTAPESEPEPEPRPRPEPELDHHPVPEPAVEPGPAARTGSGYTFHPGQEVLAFVHGAWHPAVVVSRARRTVVVDYRLGPGPLGARRQRVGVDRVRPLEPGTGAGP